MFVKVPVRICVCSSCTWATAEPFFCSFLHLLKGKYFMRCIASTLRFNKRGYLWRWLMSEWVSEWVTEGREREREAGAVEDEEEEEVEDVQKK